MRMGRVSMMVAAVLALGAAGAHAQDVAEGESLFKKQCGVCHTVEAGKNRVGPSLAAVFGRKAGSIAGFAYSEPMKGSGLTWDAETLDKYLADPKAVVPGGKMVYAGMKKADDRKNVIAFLQGAK